MMRGSRTRQGLALLQASGRILAGCAAALMAANLAWADVKTDAQLLASPSCRPLAGALTNPPADSHAKVCTDAGNGAPGALNTHNGNTGQTDTGATIKEGRGEGTGPDDTGEGSHEKPQRAAILSRSWRQIFPRAN